MSGDPMFLRHEQDMAAPEPAAAATATATGGFVATIEADAHKVVAAVEHSVVVTDFEKATHFLHKEIVALRDKCVESPAYMHTLRAVDEMKHYVKTVYARAAAEGHKITAELHEVFVGGLGAFLAHTMHSVHEGAVHAVREFGAWALSGVDKLESAIARADP